MASCRQAGAAGGILLAIAYKSEGGDRMTDYEMLMIVLTILTLLIVASKRNDR